MLKGFKDFILRGNVIDLAVAVVIGAAFTAIVTSFADNLINPLIASVGGANADGLGFYIRAGKEATFMDFGKIITSALNFLITAGVVYFIFVLPMNKFKELSAARAGTADEEDSVILSSEAELLVEIRDLLKAQRSQR